MRILIAGASTRAPAMSAQAAGYEILTLDYFGDYDQKACCENYSLLRDFRLPFSAASLYQASRSLAYDALVYTAGLENHAGIVEKMAASKRIIGNSPEVLARARDWPAFFATCERLGLPGPATLVPGRPGLDDGTRTWLRKPVRSGGGHDISRRHPSRRPGAGFFLQEYLPGRPCSAAFVADGSDAWLLGVSEQLIGREEFGGADFTYCGNIFPLPAAPEEAPADIAAQVQRLASGLTRAFRLVGLNGLDFVLHRGQPRPLELNPRYSASMELIELACGISMFDCHVQAAGRVARGFQDAQTAKPASEAAKWHGVASRQDRPAFFGKAILYAERDCRAPDTRGWPERGIRDVPFPGDAIERGSPVCTILASGPTAAGCQANLTHLAEELKGEIYA